MPHARTALTKQANTSFAFDSFALMRTQGLRERLLDRNQLTQAGCQVPLEGVAALALGRAHGGCRLEAAVDRPAIDAEDLRGARLVATDSGEHLADIALVDLVEREQLGR
jgi:hypothetical protein